MASKYWLKLYHEMLDDPKVARLNDSAYRRFIECLLMAGELDEGGLLPPLEDMAWRIRASETALAQDMSRLALGGMVELQLHEGGERWFVSQFAKRQAAIPPAERKRNQRDREKRAEYYNVTEDVTEDVTIRDTDIDIDTDIDKDTEKIKSKNTLAAPAAEYAEILQTFQESFPDKPQPRAGNKTLQGKLNTRLKSPHFKENWRGALTRAGQSQFVQNGSWFDLAWFLKNDDNYEKCLNGNYDDGQSSNGQNEPALTQTQINIKQQAEAYYGNK